MSTDLERGLEKQRHRYHLLRAFYQQVGTAEHSVEGFFAIAQTLGLSAESAEEALLYLEGESLLERMSQGESILLTDKGAFEIEQSLLQPYESTEHFSATIIQSFQGNGAANPAEGAANPPQNT